MTESKARLGNFFEDFAVGQVHRACHAAHAHERRRRRSTRASTGRASPCSPPTSSRGRIGYPRAPVDDLLVFHTVFGKTVPDISLNAIANLGYAECRFLGAGLSRRHAERGLRGDRRARELQPRLRRRLRAHHGPQPARRAGARVRALGDGEEARQGRAAPRARGAEARRARRSRRRSARRCRRSTLGATTSRSPARRIAGATTRPARRSTTPTP